MTTWRSDFLGSQERIFDGIFHSVAKEFRELAELPGNHLGGGNSNIFLEFSPQNLGEMIQVDDLRIFFQVETVSK